MRFGEERELVCARQGPPICVGVTPEGSFLGSDVLALIPHTREIVFLDDGDVCALSPGHMEVTRIDGTVVERKPQHVSWEEADAGKGVYPHYMLKEIHEQPDVLARTAFSRIDEEGGDVDLGHEDLGDGGWSDDLLRGIFDHAAGVAWEGDAGVVVAAKGGDTGQPQRGQGQGVVDLALPVTDPDLDRSVRMVRADRPPDLGALDDGTRSGEEVHEISVFRPVGVGVRNATAGKAAGENLGPRGVQPGVVAEIDRAVRRERQQLGHDTAQGGRDRNRTVGAAHPGVKVDRPGVVDPGDVPQLTDDAGVVRRVDDLLFLPGAEGVHAADADADAERLCDIQ